MTISNLSPSVLSIHKQYLGTTVSPDAVRLEKVVDYFCTVISACSKRISKNLTLNN